MTALVTGCAGAAALCAADAAGFFAEGRKARGRIRLLGVPVGAPAGSAGTASLGEAALARARRLFTGTGRAWLCLPVGALVAFAGASVLPLVAGAAAVPLVRRRLRVAELRGAGERLAGTVVALCGATAGELRAGLQPGPALAAAAGATGGLGGAEPAVLAAVRFGGDVPAALREAAREPGAGGLAGLAACWRVAVDGGAGLAAGLDRLERALRAESDQREGLRAQLAGAWSTVVLLALLPLVGLGLGSAMGARPLHVLLHTVVGAVCLVAGALLEAAGLWWAGRIVRAGESV